MIYACDNNWWKTYFEQVRAKCTGEFWTINKHCSAVLGLNFIESEQGGGVSKNPGVIRQGGNSGFQAVSLALLFGASKIVLTGFDMQATNGRTHWHGDHKGKLHNPERRRFASWRERFDQMAKETPVEIVNASRETALSCFPRVGIDESLSRAS